MPNPIITLLRPVGHGAYGPLDELLNLIPLVLGGLLLLYLYVTSRKRRSQEEKPEQDQQAEHAHPSEK